jgi:superfamily II DNA or RNA helicase
MSFAPGSLVSARGREWVVLPGSADDLLLLRPLGGQPEEETGILTALEEVRPASFSWPGKADLGDYRSARLLIDALRLGFRASAGPFRSLASVAVDPRPYQLVPLLMALRQKRVRLLVADDVGVGKTIEAGLIARELLDNGDAHRLLVLCPASLAAQWQRELEDKFNLDVALYLPATAARLERECAPGESVFERYRCLVASVDFAKSTQRREECIRAGADLVIVDEAHTCVGGLESTSHQRYQLISRLAEGDRHLLLLTATPHSGDETAFANLVGLLDKELVALLQDDRPSPELRTQLAQHLVQRRRPDLAEFLEDTPFPRREEADLNYEWSPAYREVFDHAFSWAREYAAAVPAPQARARWWSALALLRSLSSSPAALAATLRSRTSERAEADGVEEGREADQLLDFAEEPTDVAPALFVEPGEPGGSGSLDELAEAVARLSPAADTKLATALDAVDNLVAEGFRPIVFCRFVETARYVAEAAKARFGPAVAVEVVTGLLPPEERAELVEALDAERCVLVATDCLSEGINLQYRFDAVVHYDLSWNPNRHEQRVGRVDRFGQPAPVVRSVTVVGTDNPLDRAVLAVLLRKQRAIRSRLGIHVPVPGNTEELVEELVRGALSANRPSQLELFETTRAARQLDLAWEDAAEREQRSQSRFAQRSIHPDEVMDELAAARRAIGSPADLASFVVEAAQAWGATVNRASDGSLGLYTQHMPAELRAILGGDAATLRFQLPVGSGDTYLSRTHPFVAALAAKTLDAALDPLQPGPARRAAVVRTKAVARRTTLLLMRFRFELSWPNRPDVLAEDAGVLGFEGTPSNATWLDPDEALGLLEATPDANVDPAQAELFLSRLTEQAGDLVSHLEAEADRRAGEIQKAHRRVRQAAGASLRLAVRPHLPPDVLGAYILLPVGVV